MKNLVTIVLPGDPPQTLLFAWSATALCFSFYCGGEKAVRQMYAEISLMPLISSWVRVASSGQGCFFSIPLFPELSSRAANAFGCVFRYHTETWSSSLSSAAERSRPHSSQVVKHRRPKVEMWFLFTVELEINHCPGSGSQRLPVAAHTCQVKGVWTVE